MLLPDMVVSSVNVTDGNNVCSNIEKNVDQFYRKTSSIDSSRKGAAHGKERVIQGRRKILFFFFTHLCIV